MEEKASGEVSTEKFLLDITRLASLKFELVSLFCNAARTL